MKKRILSMLLVIVMVLSMVPVSALAAPGLKITSNLEMQYTLENGKDLTLTLTGTKEGDTVAWSSGNESVAEVNWSVDNDTECTVTGVGEGKLNITATVTPEGGTEQTVTYPLGVYNKVAEKPVIDGGDFSMTLGGTAKTMTYQKPDGSFGVELTRWRSSKPNVATIGLTSGELNVKAAGETKISVFFNGQWSEPVTCAVVEKLTAEIVGSSPMVVGREQELSLVFNTDQDLPETIDWRTSPLNSDLVTLTKVSGNKYKCKVKAEHDGEVEVIAAWGTPEETDKKARLTLTINKPEQFTIMRGEKVVEPADGLTLKGKETAELTAVVDNGEDLSKIEWNIVANGDGAIETQIVGNKITVMGANPGTATISAYIKDDRTDTEVSIPITVQPKAAITNKPADGSKKTLYVGDTFPCVVKTELITGEVKLVSDNTEAVEINGSDITAKKAATDVEISLMKGETKYDSFLLDVLGQARIEIDPKMHREMLTGDRLDLKAVVKDATGAVVEGKTVSWKYLDSNDANMTILGSDQLSVSPNPTIPFDVELRAYLNDEVLGELSADVTIHVTPRTASVTLMKDTENVSNKTTILSVNDAAGFTIRAVIMPENASQNVRWEVTPGDICEFTTHNDSIEIKPASTQKTGTVTVIATADDGTGVRCETKVELVKTADTIQITNAPAQMHGGANLQLRTNLDEDKTLTDRRVVWNVPKEFEQLASVTADGFLDTKPVTQPTPIKVEVTLVANGAKGEATITLCPAVTNIKIVRQNGTKLENVLAYTSKPIALGMEVTPATGYCGSFVWTSSNEKVATVNPETGVMELKDAGNVRISCTAYDTDYETALKIARGEIRDDTKVMVTGYKSLEIVKKATDVVINANGVTELVSGKNAVFTATVYADLATGLKAGNQDVTWSVVDENYEPTNAATINSRGRLYAKAVNRGTDVIVIARSVENKDAYAEYSVRIKPKQEKTFMAVMTADPEDMVLGSSLNLNIGVETSVFGQWYIREDDAFAPEYDCTYFTSNSAVASIDANGTLKTQKAGSTVITVRATDVDTHNVYTAKFTLRVANLVGFVQISEPTSNVLNSGNSVALSATTWTNSGMSQKAANQGVTWKVYQKNDDGEYVTAKAASVSSGGKVYAHSVTKNTTVWVVAISKENADYYDWYQMTIRPKYNYTLRVFYGDTVDGKPVERTGTWNVKSGDADDLAKVKAKAYDAAANSGNGDDETPTVTWSTSNSKIIDVDGKGVGNNLIFGGKTGKVKVTAKYVEGKNTYTASMYLNVVKPVTTLSVESKTGALEMYSGKTLLVVAKVNSDATNKRVYWSFANPVDYQYASINATTGLIRANKGLTKKVDINVMATAADNPSKSATKQITIYPLASKVTIKTVIGGKSVTVPARDINRGESTTLTAELTPVGEANQAAVKWTSSRTSIVKVDQTGKITAGTRRGTATIKAAATDGSGKYATIKVTVK